ncbi:hypothetical protein LCGC14_0491410 [marine sediment metagenome]|uniref:Uncharacterized protein n=1 Tax=marine sediment metagenome TaxID=412755 RepID=A0A0F9VF82_9ZZZZ
MSPFEWAMMIMAALSTASALTSSTDIEEQTPALPGGASPADIKPIMGAGGMGGIPNLPANVPTLEGPVKATAAAATTVPQPKVTTPPQLEGPPESRAGKPEETGGIGQILAALPQALVAAAPLLGLGPQPIPTQRPAPVAGGQPGKPVGQFAQPFGQQTDIAQLLAALPGIRG